MRNWNVALAALVGLLSVGFGAFAAHGMSDPKAVEWLRTASQYAAVHALAVLAVAGLARGGFPVVRGTSAAFLIGALVFSGSLVAMAFGAPRGFGAITPIGGLAFMAGWGMVIWAAMKRA
ncbi:MAG: DUF423 domain-containing protein [Caulobacteraceae bacterium]|nr:MAG: DUF423 domain-containing protein [Caulobacteraceae bacterium]